MIYEQEKRKIQEMKIMDSKTKEIQKILSENKDLLRSFKDNPETGINTILCIIKDIRQRRKKLASPVIIECTYPPVFVSSGKHDLPKMFGKLKLNMSYKDKSEYIPDGENRRKYLPAISTEVIAKIKPGGESIAISSLNNNESWCGNGCDLFLINTDGKVEITLKFANYIDGIAVSNTGEILFTESQGHHIKKYSSNGKVAIIANTLPYKTKGLCLTTEQDVLVCLYKGENDNKVVRMSLNGQIKQTIKYNKQNQSLFIDPTEVTENYNGDVCVVDNCNYVVVVNKDGQFKFKYPDFDSSTSIKPLCCYGIACDKLGNILLSDHKNNRIHQIDCDGNFLQFVLASEHGIEYPWGLSIDDEGKLWVCNETGDEVRVYKYRS
ncbi:hypothetical protein KUTeg_024142 [Tegillarca granosa]|uniref:Tripartite motif-containing protein 2 n=1 Tax=Tegillarca granosa TaxID=220873 RepID=A0ABQ9E1M6_TEGGR|nr:hypothetical protein KUTeg_024142 [Tegillarca granosa]